MEVTPIIIEESELIFYYPITYSVAKRSQFIAAAQQDGYSFFHLQQKQKEGAYYGGHRISHIALEQFFYPFLEDKLFPETSEDRGFCRFSKVFNTAGQMQVRGRSIPFSLSSVDLILCPFGIAFTIIRVAMREHMQAGDVLDFSHFFRVLVPQLVEETGATIDYDGSNFSRVDDLIKNKLLPFLEAFFVDYEKLGEDYKHMPFFEDERMFVSGFLRLPLNDEIPNSLLYRIGQLNGTDKYNQPYISTSNERYIERYLHEHMLDRWAPHTYHVTSNQAHMQITNQSKQDASPRICEFYSVDYYTVIIHFFYKIILLKLTFEHSELKWGKEKFVVDELIERITKFSSRYYFNEVVVRSEGQEISQLLRKHFRINDQYKEIKATLEELYRLQEDQEDERQSMFLFILTIYTVVSGIYGMNVVIDDWKGSVDWSKLFGYTFFEWVAWVLGITGIALSFTIVGRTMFKAVRIFLQKWRRKKYE